MSLGDGSTAGSRTRAREGAAVDVDETLPRWDEEDRDAAEELAIRMANLSHRMKTEAFKKSRCAVGPSGHASSYLALQALTSRHTNTNPPPTRQKTPANPICRTRPTRVGKRASMR